MISGDPQRSREEWGNALIAGKLDAVAKTGCPFVLVLVVVLENSRYLAVTL